MASLIDGGIDSLLSQMQQQIDSGCISKQLFSANIQVIRDLCANYDVSIANMQSQINQINADIDLCCGSNGGGRDVEETGDIDLSVDLSEWSACSLIAAATFSFSGTNGNDNPAAFESWVGDFVVFCDGTEIGRQQFAASAQGIQSDQAFSAQSQVSIPNLSCAGTVTFAIENESQQGNTNGTINYVDTVGLSGNCTDL